MSRKECWNPNPEEKKYLELIISMSVDCLMNKGTGTRKGYLTNIKMIGEQLDKLKEG